MYIFKSNLPEKINRQISTVLNKKPTNWLTGILNVLKRAGLEGEKANTFANKIIADAESKMEGEKKHA